jgi:protein ImuB
MTVAHARALVPGGALRVEPFDADADADALERLAGWALRFSPVVAVDPPDGLLIDATGSERLWHGERRLVNAVGNSIERLGFACRVAVAPTFAGAAAVARWGADPRVIVPAGALPDALGPLPVRALRVDEDTEDALAELGVERIGQALELPRDALPARFGEGLLLALDRALGLAMEPIDPVRPAPPPSASRAFDGPVRTPEPVALACEEALGLLCEQLERLESGARLVRLRIDRSDLDPVVVEVPLSRPSRDRRHLWSLLRPRVEGAHLGFGVDGVTLTAARVGALRHEQRSCWGGSGGGPGAEDGRLLGELADTLAGRLGAARVTRAEAVDSHVPERAFRAAPVVGRRVGLRRGSAPASPAWRPTRLFDPPEAARVIAVTPDGPPYRVRWRGEEHPVAAAVGPERLAGEWWADPGSVIGGRAHDYFRVRTAGGRWLWLRREVGSSGWVVHGEWA